MELKKWICPGLTVAIALLLGSWANANDQEEQLPWWRLDQGEWRMGTGVDYSSGDYGESEDTDILYVPISLRYATDAWTFKVTVPYLRSDGPGNVVGAGDGGIVIGGVSGKTKTESGLGDVVTAITYTLPGPARNGTFIDFTGKVKFGTADEDKGLGTGENDYYVQLDLAKTFGRFTPLITGGYRFVGEPSGADLDDVMYGSIGTDFRFTRSTTAGLLYDYREASSSTADDSSEVFGYVSHRLSPAFSVTGYGATGFTDGSPDFNAGLQLNWTLNP